MRDILLSLLVVFVLLGIGALFVATEIALVSLRESQLRAIGATGKRGQRVLQLSANPNRFLAAAQIGVTFAGFMSAAFGEARLSKHLEPVLVDAGLSPGLADGLSLVVITLIISYFAIVFGELVPKRFGLQRSEGVATALAPFVDRVANMSRPAIWFLSRSTDAAVRLLGLDPSLGREAISEEELRDLVAAHESLTRDERQLIDEVFAAGERAVKEVMIPRTEVTFLEAGAAVSRASREARALPHSRYPVVRASQDDVVGFVHVRDLFMPPGEAKGKKVGDVTREVKMLPGTKKVLAALSEMRREGHHLAIVIDEYGGTAGIVTLEDLIEEVIGDIRDEYDDVTTTAQRLRGGALDVDGLLNLDEFCEQTGVELPDGPYETAAGFVLNRLGHLPRVGEAVEVSGARLTVTALDVRRIERLRVTPLEGPAEQ